MTRSVALVRPEPPRKRAKGPHRGHSPGNFLFASGRAEPCLTSGGEAGTKMAKSSKTTPHIRRRSRNEDGQIFEDDSHIRRRSRNEDGQIFKDDSSHRAAKPERRWPNLRRRLPHRAAKPERRGSNLRRRLLTSGGEAGAKIVK